MNNFGLATPKKEGHYYNVFTGESWSPREYAIKRIKEQPFYRGK